MSKLTKAQAKLHNQACDLLSKEALTWGERWFVVEHWQESANHVNSSAGAFFTPVGLATDFALEASGETKIIDLCAGIGALSLAVLSASQWDPQRPRIVCIEKNPDYVAVGRKVLPEADWFECDVFDALDVGFEQEPFDCAISNPPFGATPRHGRNGPRFTGPEFEYHVIDIAAKLARRGAFIIPQMSAPFRYSGQRHFERAESDRYKAFRQRTGITLAPGVGIDCAYHERGWKGVSPKVEIVKFDLDEDYGEATEAKPTAPKPLSAEEQTDLFARETAA